MSRLTEKSTNYDFYFPKKKVSILDLSNKLGKLEDLEEELECPLEVVFEALKEGIVIDKSKYFNGKKFTEDETKRWFPTISLVKIKLSNTWSFDCCVNIYDLKDYKKTWWLPSDKEWELICVEVDKIC